jgi:hypothetical protein
MDFDFDRALGRLSKEQEQGLRRRRFRETLPPTTVTPSLTAENLNPDHTRATLASIAASVRDCSLGSDEGTDSNGSNGAGIQDLEKNDSEGALTLGVNSSRRTPKKSSKSNCLKVPSLQELCLQSLCQNGLQNCKTLHDIPDHLVFQAILDATKVVACRAD